MSSQDGYVEEDTNFNYNPLFSFSQGRLTIGAPIQNELLTTFGNSNVITELRNPNNNNVIVPSIQVGGDIMGTGLVLGVTSVTKFLSNTSGTYIYSNLDVSGVINNIDLIN